MSETKFGKEDPEFTKIVDDLHARRMALGWRLPETCVNTESVLAAVRMRVESAKR
jgi:hypothetical protein